MVNMEDESEFHTAVLLGTKIPLETFYDKETGTVGTTTSSNIVEGLPKWVYHKETKEYEAEFTYTTRIKGTKNRLQKGFAKVPLSAFTLGDLDAYEQLCKYITLHRSSIENPETEGKFLRPASIEDLETELIDHHGGKTYFKKGHMNIVQNVSLLVLFLFSKENRKVLHPFIKTVVEEMREVEMEALVMNLQLGNEKKIKLTLMGETYFYELVEKFFLKSLKEKSFKLERRHYKTEKTDAVLAAEALRPNYLFRRAYEHLCWTQEKHFVKMMDSYWIPFTFQWESAKMDTDKNVKSDGLPHISQLTPQSLSNLSLEKIGGNIECNACRDGKTTTFYGRNITSWTLKERDGNERNHTGTCVRILSDLLKDLGVTEADANNGYILRFIGTWEQAEERIRVFKEQQRKIRDTPQYNMFEYYTTLITLQIDYHLKFIAGFSRQGSNMDEEGFREAFGNYYEQFQADLAKQSKKEGWERVTGTAKLVGGRIVSGGMGLLGLIWDLGKKLIKYGGMILYKVFTLLLESPIMREWMLQSFESWVENVCMGWGVEEAAKKGLGAKGTTDIVRENNGSLERFFERTGTWHKLGKEEQEKIATETNDAWYAELRQRGAKLAELMTNYMGEGKFKDSVQTFAIMNGQAFTKFFDALQNIPYIGFVFAQFGSSKIQNMIAGYAVVTGNKIFSEMFERNMKKADTLIRFTLSTMQLVSCAFPWNTSVIRYNVDGDKMGTLRLFVKKYRKSFANAFTNVMYNLPYYALLVLCAEEANKKDNNRLWGSRAYWVEQLVHWMVVGTSNRSQSKINKSQGRTKAMTLEDRFEDNPSMGKTTRQRGDRLQKLKDRRDEVKRWLDSEIKKYSIQKAELAKLSDEYMEKAGLKFGNINSNYFYSKEGKEENEKLEKMRQGILQINTEIKRARQQLQQLKARIKEASMTEEELKSRASASDTSLLVIKGAAMLVAAWLAVLAAEAAMVLVVEAGGNLGAITTEAAGAALEVLGKGLRNAFVAGKGGVLAFITFIKGKAVIGMKSLRILVQYFKGGAEAIETTGDLTGKFIGFAELLKQLKEIVGWKGITLGLGGSYMTFDWAKNYVKDTWFAPKLFPLQTVLLETPLHSTYFYVMIKKYMYQFQGKGWGLVKDSYDIQKKKEMDYVNVKGLIASKESVVVDWPESHDFLDLEEVYKFFGPYQSAENKL